MATLSVNGRSGELFFFDYALPATPLSTPTLPLVSVARSCPRCQFKRAGISIFWKMLTSERTPVAMNTIGSTTDHNQLVLQVAMIENHRRVQTQQEVTEATSIRIFPLTDLDRRRFEKEYIDMINNADTPLNACVRRRLRREHEQQHTLSTELAGLDIDMDADTDFSSLEDEDEKLQWENALPAPTPLPDAGDDGPDSDDEREANSELKIDVDIELGAAFDNLDVDDELLSSDPDTESSLLLSAPPSTWVEWMALLASNHDELLRQSRHNREQVMEGLVREAQAEVSQKRRDRSRSRSPIRLVRTAEMYRQRDYFHQ